MNLCEVFQKTQQIKIGKRLKQTLFLHCLTPEKSEEFVMKQLTITEQNRVCTKASGKSGFIYTKSTK